MTQLLNDFLSGSAAWGVLLTLAAFALGALINKLTGKAIFNPLLLGSIFAQMFNTSFYKVKVSRISFDTDSGTLSGLLYLPKGVVGLLKKRSQP